MPVYPYQCDHCGFSGDIYKSLDIIERPEYCPQCSASMTRLVRGNLTHTFNPYMSDTLSPFPDKPILVESPSHRKQLEKERNVVPWWPGQGKKGCWV